MQEEKGWLKSPLRSTIWPGLGCATALFPSFEALKEYLKRHEFQ